MKPDEIFRREADSITRHDAKAFAANYAKNAAVYDPQYAEPLRGDAIRKDMADFFAAFPDLKAEVVSTIVDGASFAAEWSVSGTHQGMLSMADGTQISPTQRHVAVRGASVGRFNSQGLIAEERRYYDLASMQSQLGLTQ